MVTDREKYPEEFNGRVAEYCIFRDTLVSFAWEAAELFPSAHQRKGQAAGCVWLRQQGLFRQSTAVDNPEGQRDGALPRRKALLGDLHSGNWKRWGWTQRHDLPARVLTRSRATFDRTC